MHNISAITQEDLFAKMKKITDHERPLKDSSSFIMSDEGGEKHPTSSIPLDDVEQKEAKLKESESVTLSLPAVLPAPVSAPVSQQADRVLLGSEAGASAGPVMLSSVSSELTKTSLVAPALEDKIELVTSPVVAPTTTTTTMTTITTTTTGPTTTIITTTTTPTPITTTTKMEAATLAKITAILSPTMVPTVTTRLKVSTTGSHNQGRVSNTSYDYRMEWSDGRDDSLSNMAHDDRASSSNMAHDDRASSSNMAHDDRASSSNMAHDDRASSSNMANDGKTALSYMAHDDKTFSSYKPRDDRILSTNKSPATGMTYNMTDMSPAGLEVTPLIMHPHKVIVPLSVKNRTVDNIQLDEKTPNSILKTVELMYKRFDSDQSGAIRAEQFSHLQKQASCHLMQRGRK